MNRITFFAVAFFVVSASACHQQEVTDTPQRTGAAYEKVASIHDLALGLPASLGQVGECDELPDRSFAASNAGRTLVFVEPDKAHAQRRFLVTFDQAGAPMHISDIDMRGLRQAIDIDLITGIGSVERNVRTEDGKLGRKYWRGPATDMVSDPTLGSPLARAKQLWSRCGSK